MYSTTFILILVVAVASAATGFKGVNNSSTKTSSSDKIPAKSASARSEFSHSGGFDHHYPHHFGGHHYGHHLGFGHFKDHESFLLPMLIVLGLGVLVMPLLSVLMTTMVGNVPVTTLVSGRRRRATEGKVSDQTIMDIWGKVGKAIEAFTKEYQ